MEIREAVEADAERMAELADSPPDVMRNLVHDRTVRVAYDAADGDEDDEEIVGLVSFDARDSTVHVTQIAGTSEACRRLLEEPLGFARREGMSVEALLPEGDEDVQDALEAVGFEARGSGPRFEGRETTRYRVEPSRAEQ
ncbi:hypothetical protein [Halomicrobium salinisoli]|uniref:hypothetical protein n=1 Tax=Halomicrobium salinisoli TaxID=2878391 RepID=UPI001CEFB9F3|nr:hypothetical protein [Halomicrobium salinisoli]